MLTRRFSTALSASTRLRPTSTTSLPSSFSLARTALWSASKYPATSSLHPRSPTPSPLHLSHSPLTPPPTPHTSSSTSSSSLPALGRQGTEYVLSPSQVEEFHRQGYLHLKGVLSESELSSLESTYMRFMNRQIPVPGKDFCDMSGDFDRPYEEFSIINAMLPRVYHPPLQGNVYEKRAASITRQLFGDAHFAIDYDQLLAKKPTKGDAVFAWHVDLAYWPLTPDTRTATFSLALDATTKQNGCLRFVDGSHKEPSIRPHRPVNQDRAKAHAIVCEVNERTDENPGGEKVSYCEVGRGDVTVHNERVVHGSGGNYTQGWRRTYVLAFRHQSTIDMERKAGFTHSHNDQVNWDVFHKWQMADKKQ